MVGKIIRQERIKQKIKSKDLAEAVGVDTGYLSHIEKGFRNPSKSVLAKICDELNLSYQFMLNIAQTAVEEESDSYDVTTYVPYNKVLYTEEFKLLDCPKEINGVSLVTKMPDDSMSPIIKKDDIIYINYTSILNPEDIAVVMYNEKILIRNFKNKNGKISLIANNKNYKNIIVDDDSNFSIIGKILL